MANPVQIENIEAMRRQQGIEDVELREVVSRLVVGDVVVLTLLSGTDGSAGETVRVRITSIKGSVFRGKLLSKPFSVGLKPLRVGAPLAFSASHIHSVPKMQPVRVR